MCEARETGLPVSAISACRKSSKRLLISATMASSMLQRSTTDSLPQGPFRAALAAATAASTSGLPASWTMPIRELSTGLRFSYRLPLALDTYSPLMKFRMSFMSYSLLVVARPLPCTDGLCLVS